MFLTYLCTILLLLTGFLLMFIVLLQRGRGGGLAGAFGGLGGQSAFGTKAGDVFTKITIVLAVIWVSLAGVTGFAMRYDSSNTSFKSNAKEPDNPELTNPPDKIPPKSGGKKPTVPPISPDEKKKPSKPEQKKDSVTPETSPKAKQKSPNKNNAPEKNGGGVKPKS
jgi:preprotein translocase subunit SecG